MSGSPIRTSIQRAGLWGLFVVLVVLFTLLFSFLGTITCAVLAGMMTGAIGHRRHQAVLASLVFPAVMIALAQFSKADVAVRQRLLLASVCFGAFWVPYGVTLLLMSFESVARKTAAEAGTEVARPREEREAGEEGAGDATARWDIDHQEANGLRWDDFSLEEIQGQWWCEARGLDGQSRRRRMDIAGDRFALGILNGDGRVRFFAKGALRLEGEGRRKTLVLAAPRRNLARGPQDGAL